MIVCLVHGGHDPNATNTTGRLPLDHALARNKHIARIAHRFVKK